jgi:putative transposase
MKDESNLFTFYHYPAEHWQHIRSTNTIDSVFATVRRRTAKTRGQGSMATTLAMVLQLLAIAYRLKSVPWSLRESGFTL